MSIRLLTADDRRPWDEYVSRAQHASCYHRIAWKNVIETSFGHRTWYLLSEDVRRGINGILPLVQMKSVLFGNFMVSLPYFNYGGICADSDGVRDQLLQEAVRLGRDRGASHIELRHTGQCCGGQPVKTSKVSMRLELPASADDLWSSFSSKLRSQTQRPMREGMYAKLGREESLDDFYAVFAANMRDLGTPVYSKGFFRNILRALPASTWICTVYTVRREPIAAGFLVGFKDTLEIPWASSLRKYNRYSPNMLLYWSVLRLACKKGYKVFDFGRSTPGEGTYKFKEQWGARPMQLYWHYWMRNGEGLPEMNPKNPKYRAAIEIWKRLPLGLTKLVGPSIVKNLP
jgi:serine/alanine adding enzyme